MQTTLFDPREQQTNAHTSNEQSTHVRNIRTQPDDNKRTRCEVWTRVMGYHRPVSSFNIGKKGEFNERLFFTENQRS